MTEMDSMPCSRKYLPLRQPSPGIMQILHEEDLYHCFFSAAVVNSWYGECMKGSSFLIETKSIVSKIPV